MSAKEILAIEKCGDLFPYGENMVKDMYRSLAKEWHPDTNTSPEASDVFDHITKLYNRALKLLKDGLWEKKNFVMLCRSNGKRVAISYDTCFEFELGVCYVTSTKVIYVLGADKEKYFDNAVSMIKSIRYPNKEMEDKMKLFFPKIYEMFGTMDGEHVLVLEKTKDVYPLKTVWEYFDQKIDDKHVAWMVSRLCNLECCLEFNKLAHNGININNCFVSPHDHSILLLGGWWYTTKVNDKMIGTTKDIFSIMPISAKSSKKSSTITDLESVKLLGRHLLGETNCRKLALNRSIPKPFIDFLIGGSSNNSFEEFGKWDKALSDSYGRRRFIKMEIKNPYERKGEN